MRRMGSIDWVTGCVCAGIVLATGAVALADHAQLPSISMARLLYTDSRSTTLDVDHAGLLAASERPGKFRVPAFPLSDRATVDLELQAYRVAGPNTTFVLGRPGGPDEYLPYDWSRIKFFRGHAPQHAGSHVFLALIDGRSTGVIDLGAGRVTHRISSRDSQGRPLPAGQISVFPAGGSVGGAPNVPLCGLDAAPELKAAVNHAAPRRIRNPIKAGTMPSTVLMKHLELAVETDYELFEMLGDATATMDYVVAMYGEVSAIFMRDVDLRIELSFVRVWDQPDDLFNGPDPLGEFRPYWDNQMGAVQRDSAQFFSGRRDFPFGGQAYLSSMCSGFGYGVVGYAVGFSPDPTRPHRYNWDVHVTAHELGHSAGTLHTHDLGLDTCQDPLTTPQRGSIMAYCGQTWSGMNANTDNYFHSQTQASMDAHIADSTACIVPDCNFNGIDDAVDVLTTADVNGNSIPDECEDCNGNGVLDPTDISMGMPDVNGNGIPDECEPDCNNNGIPDDEDISSGFSTDAYGNDIPDECEDDCDASGGSDYTQIQQDITLDRNRDAILDACQDCDEDGPTDLEELAGAHGMWVASGESPSPLRAFHGQVGVLMQSSTGATVGGGQDVIVVGGGSTARVLVSDLDGNRIMEFDADGVFVQNLVSGGGLSAPAGLVMLDDDTLLVANSGGNNVLAFDGMTGAAMGTRVSAGAGGLSGPFGMTLGPDGKLYVTSSADEVLAFDAASGAFEGVLVSSADNGGLSIPRGLAFKPDGNLLVASLANDSVLEFDGATGRPRGKWAQVGTATNITQDSPWGIRVGPNGHVFVTRTGPDGSPAPDGGTAESHLTDARMFEYDVSTGDFRKTHIGGQDHGLNFATGFDFVDGFDIDCNLNQLQDDCDIAAGFSLDLDTNGVPDECQIDCNSNGVFDRQDLWPRGASLDCNFNFVPDECDLAASSSDCNANGVPDECESDFDCNNNGVQDICELFDGSAVDGDANGLLDSCEVGDGTIVAVDFESGLPAGWIASGILNVTGNCEQNAACDGSSWAYFGDSGSCSYDDGQAGGLQSPPIELPLGNNTLEFCYDLNTENNFDFADVTVNNVRMLRLSGSSGGWVNESIDLRQFEGQTITIVFRLASDGGFTLFGWQVDDIRVSTVCEGPDDDGDTIPDVCDVCVGDNASGDSDGDAVCDDSDVCPGFNDFLDANDNGTPDGCEADVCITHGDCADLDEDGIRDDPCLWWSCDMAECVSTPIGYADLGGEFGTCPPDGTADGNDRFHALNCFSDLTTLGAPGYACEANPPMAFNVDAAGLNAPCTPDGVCDGNDAFAALNAFEGTTTCSCGPSPVVNDPPGGRSISASLALQAERPTIGPGEVVEVDVLLSSGLDDLRGYQLHFGIEPGKSAGQLEVLDIAIHPRPDRAFAGDPDWSAFNLDTRQMVAGLDTAGRTTAPGAYLATLTLRASRDATGTFVVDLLDDRADPHQRTKLFATAENDVILTATRAARITVRAPGVQVGRR